MNPQFKRGILELLVLKTIKDRPRSGYGVMEALGKDIDVGLNTIYPVLRRLTKRGLFTVEREKSAIGAPRKIYRITKEGEKRLLSFKHDWETFLAKVLKILGGGFDD